MKSFHDNKKVFSADQQNVMSSPSTPSKCQKSDKFGEFSWDNEPDEMDIQINSLLNEK